MKGTNTIFFVHKHKVPEGRFKDVTCVKFVRNERPQKKEVNRTRMTAGGNRINCPGEVATPTADMMLTKILWNRVVSTEGARFMTMDLKDFCLNTPLRRCEHLELKMTNIPNEVQDEHNPDTRATADGHVCVEARRGMHGLPQVGLTMQEELEKCLTEHGCRQSPVIPGLWHHDWCPIPFMLVMDDFGVKCEGEEHARHLLQMLEEHCEVSTDWHGRKCIGLTLDWDCDAREVHVLLPGHVERATKELGHEPP